MIRLWIPGKFPSLSDGFELARKSGTFRTGKKRDPFNEKVQEVRMLVMAHARKAGIAKDAFPPTKPGGYFVNLCFFGHTRWDADAGAWAGKVIVDQLFGHFEDRCVRDVHCRIVRTGEEGCFPPRPEIAAGAQVEVI